MPSLRTPHEGCLKFQHPQCETSSFPAPIFMIYTETDWFMRDKQAIITKCPTATWHARHVRKSYPGQILQESREKDTYYRFYNVSYINISKYWFKHVLKNNIIQLFCTYKTNKNGICTLVILRLMLVSTEDLDGGETTNSILASQWLVLVCINSTHFNNTLLVYRIQFKIYWSTIIKNVANEKSVIALYRTDTDFKQRSHKLSILTQLSLLWTVSTYFIIQQLGLTIQWSIDPQWEKKKRAVLEHVYINIYLNFTFKAVAAFFHSGTRFWQCPHLFKKLLNLMKHRIRLKTSFFNGY